MNGRILISKKLVTINSVSSIVTSLLSVTVLIWVQQYLLKRISVEEYSLLPVIYSLMVFLPFFTLILTSGIKRYVMEAYADNQDERITQIVSSMFLLLCLGSILLLLIGIVLALNIDTVLRIEVEYVDDARIMLLLLISLQAFRLPMEAFSSGLYVHQRFVLDNLIRISCECIRIALLFALLLGLRVSVISVVIATVIAGLLEILARFFVSRRILTSQRFERSKITWPIVKELTKFGGWNSLYVIFSMLRKSADPIILNRFSTPLDVSCFHLGALVPNRLEVIVNQSVLGSVSPVVVGLAAQNQEERLKNIYLRLGRYAMWGVLLVISPFLAHSAEIVSLYIGDSYSLAASVMVLLLACYPIVYGNVLYTSLANAKIRVRSLAILESISTTVNLMLTLVLVVHYQMGAIGSALATFIVYGLGSILFFWPFGRNMVGASWAEVWRQTLLPGITPFAIALVMMILLRNSHPVDSWLDVTINSTVGATVYMAVLWLVAKENDKSQLRYAMGQIFSRRLN